MRNRYSMKPDPNDNQQFKVYDWNINYISKTDRHFLDLNTCNLICQEIHKAFDIKFPIPKVVNARDKDNSSYFIYQDNKIYMHDSMRYRPFLLHEIAHSIVRHYCGLIAANHGPQFLGIYMTLLNKWGKIPISELKRTADLNQLEYSFYKFLKIKKGFRAKLSLCNPVKHNVIKLSSRKMPGFTSIANSPKGGYILTYDHNYR